MGVKESSWREVASPLDPPAAKKTDAGASASGRGPNDFLREEAEEGSGEGVEEEDEPSPNS